MEISNWRSSTVCLVWWFLLGFCFCSQNENSRTQPNKKNSQMREEAETCVNNPIPDRSIDRDWVNPLLAADTASHPGEWWRWRYFSCIFISSPHSPAKWAIKAVSIWYLIVGQTLFAYLIARQQASNHFPGHFASVASAIGNGYWVLVLVLVLVYACSDFMMCEWAR